MRPQLPIAEIRSRLAGHVAVRKEVGARPPQIHAAVALVLWFVKAPQPRLAVQLTWSIAALLLCLAIGRYLQSTFAVRAFALILLGAGVAYLGLRAVKAAGTAARITLDGARAASHTVTKPFRRQENESGAPAL